MRKVGAAVVLQLLSFGVLCAGTNPGLDFKGFSHSVDLASYYRLHWILSDDLTYITFGVNVTLKGSSSSTPPAFVGFGIAEQTSGSMPGADIVGLEVNASSSTVTISDYFAHGKYTPTLDSCQSWTLNTATFITNPFDSSQKTFLAIFGRSTSNNLDMEDRSINTAKDEVTRIIWALGSSSSMSYHNENRGSSSIAFNPSTTSNSTSSEELMSWTFIASNYTIPAVVTTYSCQTFYAPDTSNATYYAKGFEMVLSGTTVQAQVHHAILFACQNGTTDYFKNMLSYPAVCPGGPSDTATACYQVMYVWAPGEDVYMFPDGVYMPIGKDGYTNFVIEYHYNNPLLASGEIDASGVKILFSSTRGTYEAGVMQIGDPSLQYQGKIPHGVSRAHFEYDCPPECTSTMSQPITIFGEFLHTHHRGVEVMSYVSRNNTPDTFEPLTRVEYYDYGFQHISPKNTTIYPGDRLNFHCVYDTSADVNDTKFFVGSDDEMCIDFVMYYPKSSTAWYGCGYSFSKRQNDTVNHTFCGTLSNRLNLTNPSKITPGNPIDRLSGVPYTGTCSAVIRSSFFGIITTKSSDNDKSTLVSKIVGGVVGGLAGVGLIAAAMLFIKKKKDARRFTIDEKRAIETVRRDTTDVIH